MCTGILERGQFLWTFKLARMLTFEGLSASLYEKRLLTALIWNVIAELGNSIQWEDVELLQALAEFCIIRRLVRRVVYISRSRYSSKYRSIFWHLLPGDLETWSRIAWSMRNRQVTLDTDGLGWRVQQ
jgi:hypothetical protein